MTTTPSQSERRKQKLKRKRTLRGLNTDPLQHKSTTDSGRPVNKKRVYSLEQPEMFYEPVPEMKSKSQEIGKLVSENQRLKTIADDSIILVKKLRKENSYLREQIQKFDRSANVMTEQEVAQREEDCQKSPIR
jgi:regulator of replication initiation timing